MKGSFAHPPQAFEGWPRGPTRADPPGAEVHLWALADDGAVAAVLACYGAVPGPARGEAVRDYTPTKRPRAEVGRLRWSLSHSGSVAVVAVAERAVGVDLERPRRVHDPVCLAKRVLPEEEAARVAAAASAGDGLADPTPAFLRGWTRMEAYAKSRGEGIGAWLAATGQRFGDDRVFLDVVPPLPGWFVGLAVAPPAGPVRRWHR